MADQDFNIKVVTTADTTGIRQTSAELDKLKQQQATFAATQAKVQAQPAPVPPVGGGAASLAGSAVAIGTITALLTGAIRKWQEFEDEQDRAIAKMVQTTARMRELGESILDMQDKARDAARTATEPLQQSFVRLQQEIIRVKTEMSALDLPRQGDEWKKLNAEANTYQSQLNGVTAALQKEKESADKATRAELEKRVPGLGAKPEIQEADAQTQRILQNEQAAATARAEGRDKDAEMFEKSAAQYKASATPQQLADLQRIHELQDKLKPSTPVTPTRQPEPGEPGGGETGEGASEVYSSEEMRQHQLNARAARYQGVQQTRGESGEAQKSRESELAAMLDRVMAKYWGQ